MPLKVVRRSGSPFLWIMGTVLGQRIRESAGTSDPKLAEERRATREAEIYRGVTHGLPSVKSFAEAAASYLKTERSEDTRNRVARFLKYLDSAKMRGIRCDHVNQEFLDVACEKMLRPGASPQTRLREVIGPVKTILRHAAIRGWCPLPIFETIRQGRARKEWLTPQEAEAILTKAPLYLRVMYDFMFCTGARRGEVLSLDWSYIQLRYARATLRDVKAQPGVVKDRVVKLPPRAVAMLASLPGPKSRGRVFKGANGKDWNRDITRSGARLNRAFQAIVRNAGIDRKVSLHVIRHSWASWHYALHKNLKKLAADGAWDLSRWRTGIRILRRRRWHRKSKNSGTVVW